MLLLNIEYFILKDYWKQKKTLYKAELLNNGNLFILYIVC